MRLSSAVAIVVTSVLVSLPGLNADTFPANGGDIEITPIVHASVQVVHAGMVIQIDPWSAGDYSGAKPADLILITDDNSHHLDAAEIQKLRKPGGAIVIPEIGKPKVPDGIVMGNGETRTIGGVSIEAIAMYDLTPGEPSHPKGRGNGYVVTIGGKRLYFAGVTECVPEIQALRNIDLAFMPMNLPLGRMTQVAAADCVKIFKPKVVYPYHYDQSYVSRVTSARGASAGTGDANSVSLQSFRDALKGQPIEVRDGNWYPAPAAR